jgi:hypothetical protein
VYKQSNIVDIRLLIRLNHYYFFMPMLKPTANNEFFLWIVKKMYLICYSVLGKVTDMIMRVNRRFCNGGDKGK